MGFRNVTRATDQRTSISTILRSTAVDGGAPVVRMTNAAWHQVFRDITNSTNASTMVPANVPGHGVGNNAPVLDYHNERAVASILVLANMNSLPFDWAARMSVGGTHMSFFIVKQLPVLPPEAYLEMAPVGGTWVELIVPRALELTYTAWDLQPFAEDLGYEGPPFTWDEERRHRLKCELDAIYAQMYQMEREDLEWILDAPEPSRSFPGLKRNEVRQFGEYRTQRYVLQAFDQLTQGNPPNLEE